MDGTTLLVDHMVDMEDTDMLPPGITVDGMVEFHRVIHTQDPWMIVRI